MHVEGGDKGLRSCKARTCYEAAKSDIYLYVNYKGSMKVSLVQQEKHGKARSTCLLLLLVNYPCSMRCTTLEQAILS